VAVTAISLLRCFILQFNFADVHLPDNRLVFVRAVSERGIAPPVPSEVHSVASGAATAISSVTSQAKSVASAVATAIPGADTIPRSLSLGTEQFCVGFSNRVECNDLPVNTSKFLPTALTSAVGDQLKPFHQLDGTLAKLSPEYIKDSFILGLAATVVLTIAFLCSIFGQDYGPVPPQRDSSLFAMLSLGIGLVCFVSFFVPTIILYTLYSKSKELPSNFEVSKGHVAGYCWGALFSAVLMTVLSTFTSTFIERYVV
jgi:hypothetical protein